MKRVGSIYKITNKIDGKVYIGQTVLSPAWDRIKYHFHPSSNSVVSRAIKKYGKENFKWEVLFEAFDLEFLDEMECFFIEDFRCIVPNGYNLESGGYNLRKPHPHTLLKNRLKNKKFIRENGSPLKGIPKTKEHIEAMSESRKGFDSRARKRAREYMVTKRKLSGDFVKITAIKIDTGERFDYNTINDCAKELNLNASCISKTSRGLQGRKQHKGYYFIRDCHAEKSAKEAEERKKAGTLRRKK